MLGGFSLGLVGFFLSWFVQSSPAIEAMPLVEWQQAQIFALPTEPDATVETIVNDYLRQLGVNANQQGVWIQTEWAELANHRGDIPASAASLTKIATSLASLETWGANHRFETLFYTSGTVKDGVLLGDLIIQGGGDPLLVWEEAIAIGNKLNEIGIRQVKGNLIIIGDFWFNFKSDSQVSGELFKRGLNVDLWTSEVGKAHENLPTETPRPQLSISGEVQVMASLPENSQLLLRHQSLTMTELLKQMNIYSNNAMAEMLARRLGGSEKITQIVMATTKIPAQEIQLINGSGLGVDNRISPRAACEMLMAIERKFAPQLTVNDLFPVGGRDKKGTMQWRAIPQGVAVKTGTLAQVSALAGVIPTKERGLVWFAIVNSGSTNIEKFRGKQDQMLQKLSQHWQIIPHSIMSSYDVFLGDPSRNLQS